jgi:hypothetical protein
MISLLFVWHIHNKFPSATDESKEQRAMKNPENVFRHAPF